MLRGTDRDTGVVGARFRVVEHAPGAPGLRLIGMGCSWLPQQGVRQLQNLLSQHTFWARQRSASELRRMLKASDAVVSVWCGPELVAFGRATSDRVYRAVLWDVVVAGEYQGQGLGTVVVNRLLNSQRLRCVERVYLMTTSGSGFYERLGFTHVNQQRLLVKGCQSVAPDSPTWRTSARTSPDC